MKINNVEMQYQTNDFRNEIMTFPKWQDKPDYIIQYGCLLCAKLNAYNLFNKDKKYLNIKQFNDLIIKHNGYFYLSYLAKNLGDINKTKNEMIKEKTLGKESYQISAIVNWILGIKNESNNQIKIDLNPEEDFYIIKTKYNETGHYSLIINVKMDYFDSYDGKIKNPYTNQKQILDIIKITFNKEI